MYRFFLVLLCLGLVAMVSPASAAVTGKVVSYRVGGVELTGYLAWDDAITGKRPGILVVHEWWGHNAYARRRADMLATMGYTAFALDMYGTGKLAGHPGDAKKFMGALFRDLTVAEKRFVAAQKILEDHETTLAGQTGAIGYCMGGGIVLHAARKAMPLKAVVSFHGSLGAKARARPGALKTPVLVLTGKDDPFVPAKQVAAFRKEMDAAKASYSVKVYEGARHSFTNPDANSFGKKYGIPLAYNAAVDRESWDEMKLFLGKYLPIK